MRPTRSDRETRGATRQTYTPEKETASSTPTKLVVAAIDFGTTYSGYAYSFLSDFKKDPLKILANTSWTGGGEGLVTDKTPTTILFTPEGKFHSFGYDAEDKYVELADEMKHKDWYYFSRFKMKLHEQKKISRKMQLTDDQGHTMPAMNVFAEAIRYLSTHLLNSLTEEVSDIRDTDIHWVITVPAIWDDGAKQFMREAGIQAGIPGNRLDLALEPEAAAIYSKVISMKKDGSSFDPGTQFIVVDLGGGTVDITVHEVNESKHLTELAPPSGGPWGGTKIDAAFNNLLNRIYGGPEISSFKRNNKADELDLGREFELKKRKFKGEDKAVFKVPITLTQTLKGQTLEHKLSDTVYEGNVTQIRDKLNITRSIMLSLFEDVKRNIIQHMKEVLMHHPGVNMIIMAGGFSESAIIKNAVHEAFPGKTVIIPKEARLAVVKGAVMYGHDTSVIISRSMPFTYGVSVSVPFDDRKHPETKKAYKNGHYQCEDNFKVFIRVGDTVVPGKTAVQDVFNASSTTSANVEIYKTKAKYPIYVDDPGCACVGSIMLQLKDISSSKIVPVQIKMSFGSTELFVEAKEEGTNNAVSARFNFLH